MYIHLSVIIPFYNLGNFIYEALESVRKYCGKYNYEIIIINDGSDDKKSLDILNELGATPEYIIIHQSNKGPGAARNAGCSIAKGEFLFFLDSDNKIKPEYIDKALAVLEIQKDVGVVYSNAISFGDKSRKPFVTNSFDIQSLLASNYIDMCSFVRKSAWQDVNGFDEDENLRIFEDWDFWLCIYEKGWKFSYLNEHLFYYRIRTDSLIGANKDSFSHKNRIAYLYAKHSKLLVEYYPKLLINNLIYNEDKKRPLRSFLKYLLYKFQNKQQQLLCFLL